MSGLYTWKYTEHFPSSQPQPLKKTTSPPRPKTSRFCFGKRTKDRAVGDPNEQDFNNRQTKDGVVHMDKSNKYRNERLGDDVKRFFQRLWYGKKGMDERERVRDKNPYWAFLNGKNWSYPHWKPGFPNYPTRQACLCQANYNACQRLITLDPGQERCSSI